MYETKHIHTIIEYKFILIFPTIRVPKQYKSSDSRNPVYIGFLIRFPSIWYTLRSTKTYGSVNFIDSYLHVFSAYSSLKSDYDSIMQTNLVDRKMVLRWFEVERKVHFMVEERLILWWEEDVGFKVFEILMRRCFRCSSAERKDEVTMENVEEWGLEGCVVVKKKILS